MIDKLDFVVHVRHDRIADEFLSALADRRSFEGRSYIQGFSERRDLERMGFHFVVHTNRAPDVQEPGFLRRFRIELGQLGRDNLLNTLQDIERLLGTSILDARVMRVDLAVDVPDTPLTWIHDHMWVALKRKVRQFEQSIEKANSSYDPINGMTYGQRPNEICVYNKTRQLSLKGKQIPVELTRFERRYGGTGIPNTLRSISSLLGNVENARPFENVRFLARGGPDTSSLAGFTGTELLKSAGFLYLQSELGAPELRRRLGSNSARILAMMPISTTQIRQEPDLDRLFRASVSEQMSSVSISPLGLSA